MEATICLEISRGQSAHCVHLWALFVRPSVCMHMLVLHILKCLNVHMWWRVYASINPLLLSCSDCSLTSLLGLAPKVAQADTRRVAKPLPQTKYQAKMHISSVPLSHPQYTCTVSCLALSVYLFDWAQTARLAIWSVSYYLGKYEALRNKSCSNILWLLARLETLWIDQTVWTISLLWQHTDDVINLLQPLYIMADIFTVDGSWNGLSASRQGRDSITVLVTHNSLSRTHCLPPIQILS